MAASSSDPEEDCTCPVCRDIYEDPVILSCGHSFCKDCLQEWWENSGNHMCPICKKLFSIRRRPARNLALRNLSDKLRQEIRQRASAGPEKLCRVHGEKLKLFCVDDQEPICLVCRDAKAHKGHDCMPIEEAAEDRKTKLKVALTHLKTKLGAFSNEKQRYDKMESHIQLQADWTERKMKEEFQKLYQFLKKEETARIDGLRKEAEQKLQTMGIRIAKLTAEIASISKLIKTGEKELEAEDLPFMLNCKSTMESTRCTLPDPVTPPGALIDEAKHAGNLLFNVWWKIKETLQYTPVTLDPNTANETLVISDDLTSATRGDRQQQVPENPERQTHVCVLGSPGLSSGRHFWVVEVSGHWAIGVAAGIHPIMFGYKQKLWGIYMSHRSRYLREIIPEDYTKLISESSFPKMIRVQLDYDQGKLSFHDVIRKTCVHTIAITFTEPVFPFFRENVKILPLQFSLTAK